MLNNPIKAKTPWKGEAVHRMRVWWIPQVPGIPFVVSVSSIEEAAKIMDVLAEYDKFQFENNIKPDYCNVGGLQMWDGDSDGRGTPGWVDWFDEETGIEDPHKYLEWKKTNGPSV